MAQMSLTDSFANAKRHKPTIKPPRVLLKVLYDRHGGCRLPDFNIEEWNLFAQLKMNKDAISKEGLGKNGVPYYFPGWLWMFRYAVSTHPNYSNSL